MKYNGEPRTAKREPSAACERRAVRRFTCALVFALSAAGVGFAADDPRDAIARGNAEFDAGRYREALEAYAGVDENATPDLLPELLNNRAAAHFKLGAYDDARELWVRAAPLRDAAFEALARYNIGNCHYAEALRAVRPVDAGDSSPPLASPDSPVDLSGALEKLDHAIENYREALRLDPSLTDARANLELAAQLKKQIEEQAQQQPQSQPSQNQDQQDEQNDEQEKQQQNQDQQQPQDQQNPDRQDQQQQQSSDEQQQNEQQQQHDQQQNQDQQSENQQNRDQQQPQQPPQPQDSDASSQQPPREVKMTPQEAQRLLQLIRDLEKQRREYLRRIQAGKHKPVDKDW